MTNPEITSEYVRELLEGISPGEWRQWDTFSVYVALPDGKRSREICRRCRDGDANFIAAAPRIAEAYLELAEDIMLYERDIETAIDGLIEAGGESYFYEEENARLRSIIEQQREALEYIKGFPRPDYTDQGNDSNRITVITRMCLMIDIASKALAAASQECKEKSDD